MKKMIRYAVGTITFAAMTFGMFGVFPLSVNAETKKETYSPKEYRWNFEPNDIGYTDLYYLGEKVQPYVNAPSDQDVRYSNIWKIAVPFNGDTIPVDEDRLIPMFSSCALPVEPYFVDHVDLTVFNNAVNDQWTNKLFSQRELGVFETGDVPAYATVFDVLAFAAKLVETGQLDPEEALETAKMYEGQTTTFAGNEGLKVWETNNPGEEFEHDIELYGVYGKSTCPAFVDYDKNLYVPLNRYLSRPKQLSTTIICTKYKYPRAINTDGHTGPDIEYNTKAFDYVRPEINLSNSRIIIRQYKSGYESKNPGPDALKQIVKSKYKTDEWKFTMLEEDRNFRISDYMVSSDGKTVNIRYNGAKKGNHEYISVIFEKGQELYYGQVALVSDDKTASINLPYEFTRDCRLCVFNEECNGPEKTNFCSNVEEILPKSKISFNANLGTCAVDHFFATDIGQLPVPTRKGYIFTGWYDNKDCLGSAITKDFSLDLTKDYVFYAGWV